MIRQLALSGLTLLLLAGCGSTRTTSVDTTVDGPNQPISRIPTPTRKPTAVLKNGGGFYKDDGPADDIPDGLDDIPDAEPKWEPLHKPATRPYVVLGKEYVPNTAVKPYKARGIASWYGKKFHGQKTSIGQDYDMFAMTAAHPTLALPSYARVTQLATGKSVIVRVNDRGPFHADRIIDLSYTAAYKLGLINGGSGEVEVEAIIVGEPGNTSYGQLAPPPRPAIADPVQPRDPQLSADATLPKGTYLQLGAFSNPDNAENLKTHLSRELDWVSEPMRITQGGGIHRLQLGPYASRDDANQIADKIQATLGYKPTVVVR